MAEQQEIIQVEVDAEQQHEHTDHDLKIRVVVGTHAQRLVAEAAGARRAEGVNERVKQWHTARAEHDRLDNGHGEIDGVEDFGAVAQFARDLAAGRAGDLSAHQVHGAAVRHGQHRHRKNKNAHTADPVGKAAPEQDTVAQRLNIGQNRGAGGRKARNHLKKGVHKGRDLAGDDKGKRTENRQQHPDQRHDGQTVAGVDLGVLGAFQAGSKAQHQQDQHRDQECGDRGPLAVNRCAPHGKEHQRRLDQEDAPQHKPYHFIIHAAALTLQCHAARAASCRW